MVEARQGGAEVDFVDAEQALQLTAREQALAADGDSVLLK